MPTLADLLKCQVAENSHSLARGESAENVKASLILPIYHMRWGLASAFWLGVRTTFLELHWAVYSILLCNSKRMGRPPFMRNRNPLKENFAIDYDYTVCYNGVNDTCIEV